jgi:two-component system, LytTR family, response regulator
MRALVIDDEPSARSRLKKLLAAFEEVDVVGEARDGVEAVSLIASTSPDLIFLDVQMPGLDGFEVLRALPADSTWPLVVFATAFDQHALAAFDANAVAYLLKPINRDRLAAAIDRASRLLEHPRQAGSDRSRVHDLTAASAGPLQQLVARTRDRYVLVPLEEICFIRMEEELTRIKTATMLYRTDYTIADLEARLPNPPFFRAHRSAIVNTRMIREIAPLINGSFLLVMKDREQSEIQVSERQSKAVRALLK